MNYYLILLLICAAVYCNNSYCQSPCSEIKVGLITEKNAFVIDTFNVYKKQEHLESIIGEISRRIYPIERSRHMEAIKAKSWLTSFNEKHGTRVFDSVRTIVAADFLPQGANPYNWISLLELHFSNATLAKKAFVLMNSEPIMPDILPLNQIFLLAYNKVYVIDSEAFYDIDECYMGNLEYVIRVLID